MLTNGGQDQETVRDDLHQSASADNSRVPDTSRLGERGESSTPHQHIATRAAADNSIAEVDQLIVNNRLSEFMYTVYNCQN